MNGQSRPPLLRVSSSDAVLKKNRDSRRDIRVRHDELLRNMMATENLTELAITSMNLEELPDAIVHFTSTTVLKLDLTNNRLKQLSWKLSSYLPNLETVDLSRNQLKTFPKELLHLKHLANLDMSNNKLIVIPKD